MEINLLAVLVCGIASMIVGSLWHSKFLFGDAFIKASGMDIGMTPEKMAEIQKKMWQIVSNPIYVANPSKGSIHNRGCAIDITLVNSNGEELDMGTPFDFFGEESSHNYQNLSEEVKRNRSYLKEVMLKHNFKSFDSEWWHYNLVDGNLEKLANFNWICN